MPPTPLALPDAIPVAGSAAEADVRWQSARLLLNTEGERKKGSGVSEPRRDAQSGWKEL